MCTKLYDSIYLYADQNVNSLHYVCKKKKTTEVEDFKIDFIYLKID